MGAEPALNRAREVEHEDADCTLCLQRKPGRRLRPTMRCCARLLRASLTASLILLAAARAAVAGPLEDGVAAVERRDYATALRLLRPLAAQGDDVAQFDLGVMYNKGWGVPRDYVQAAKWYRLAAAQGNPEAKYNLGILYDDSHRYAEAVKWYREAADQGLGDAQFNLGLLYAKGQGVPRNDIQAYMWFELSAAQGDQSAVNIRDATAQRMTPEQIAEAKTLAHEWRPTSSSRRD